MGMAGGAGGGGYIGQGGGSFQVSRAGGRQRRKEKKATYLPTRGAQKKQKKTRRSRSVVFAWDCVFLACFVKIVKTCCTSF
jgi:hypothetical protein